MKKEQEEAIEYVQKQIDYYKEQIKFIEAVDSDYYDEEYELYKNRVKQFETVLSMLKQKDKEIEKKDKIIDLYIDKLARDEFDDCCQECCRECERDYDTLSNCIKQYFERKATNKTVKSDKIVAERKVK